MWVGLTRRWWRGRLSRGEWSRTVAEEEHAAVLRGGRKALGGLCSAFRGTRGDEAISTPPPSLPLPLISISVYMSVTRYVPLSRACCHPPPPPPFPSSRRKIHCGFLSDPSSTSPL
ncbi:hypothetical protein MUK42_11228 [Musa troglodytarum]|uniref:Uncharacterized protein n=1 Tax=Musa troglodytarum TaxID=320322 RepID=A0A9E7KG58_9LILI|nr:hypothetical protein MUK42_11228 [Musa troglodytarum]